MKKIFSAIAIVFSLTSCEDVIEVEVSDGTIQLVVDAFVNNLAEPQVIKLKKTSYGLINKILPFVQSSKNHCISQIFFTNNTVICRDPKF